MYRESVVPVLVKHVHQTLCLVQVEAQLTRQDGVGLICRDVAPPSVVIATKLLLDRCNAGKQI